MKVAPWLTFVLGVWLILSPFTIPYRGPAAAFAEDLVLGALVILFSLGLAVGASPHPIAAWALVVFGIWIGIAPFVLGYYRDITSSNAVANDIITGGVILLIALVRVVVTWRGVTARKV